MTDLITEARELATENISQPTVFYKDKSQRIMLRLCDALEKHRWIPVTERLPEVGKCVLIRQTYHAFLGEHGEYEGVTIGYLHQPTDRRCKPYFYYAAVSDYGDMVRAQSICPGSEYVTHWMPLPEPPKGATHDA